VSGYARTAVVRSEGRTPTGHIAALGAAIVFTGASILWMANREPFTRGVLWGTAIVLAAAASWVAWLAPPRPRADVPPPPTLTNGRSGAGRTGVGLFAAASAGVLVTGIVFGGYAALPWTILLALACLVPAAMTRPGLASLLVVSALYLPRLGSYGLWDPWETHYGEVAREILARNDWISLWWAQDHWFWSKPVLAFWAEAWAMSALGVDYLPDANPSHPEWAVRAPSMAWALLALAVLYRTLRKELGPRAGALCVLVVATLPQFFFISRQAITDLPLVGAITIAACGLLLAVHEDPHTEARNVRLGPWEWSLQHGILFIAFLLVLPQACYLISRNLSFLEGWHLVAHPDRFLYGSPGNLGIPGNPEVRDRLPAVPGLLGQPFLQGLVWLGALGVLASVLRRERRLQRLYMAGFYLACGVAFLAKGLIGIAIPGALALFYLIATRRWALLARGALWVAPGCLLVVTVGLPWFVAMSVRHGSGFLERLLIHDHVQRLTSGVHGDTGTVDYFVRQLGYATFPWIALAPAALLSVLWLADRTSPAAKRRSETALFFGLWCATSFVLFSAMVTKFHHYLLPTVVPLGVLVGIALDAYWGSRAPKATFGAAFGGLLWVAGLSVLCGDWRGIVPEVAVGREDWVLGQARPWWGAAFVAAGVASMVASRRRIDLATSVVPSSRWSAAWSVAAVLGACLAAFVGRDLASSARPQGHERLIHLFVYNYDRLWPGHLDYRPVLVGFAIATTLLAVGLAVARWRSVAARSLTAVAIAFCAWALNVYMVDVSSHWSVKPLTQRYYASRGGPEEPLIAWQMNWKGENFYTGNRVHVFAELNSERFKRWLKEHRGTRAYVLFEHKRYGKLKRLLGERTVRELSTPREHNKFMLIEVEI